MPRSVTLRVLDRGRVRRHVFGLVALAALAALPAFSQNAGNNQAPEDVPMERRADDGAPGPAQPPRQRTRPDVGLDLPPETEPQASGPKLPEDFVPPDAAPEVMSLRKPLMTDDEIQQEENDLRRLPPRGIDYILMTGDPSPANKEALKRWANLQVAKMTAVDEWRKAGEITGRLLLDIRNAAARQSNPNRELEFRQALMAALVEACEKVFDNNFYVRMQAARILGELNEREEPPVGARKPPVSYAGAMQPLLRLIEDPQQPEPVKIAATVGLTRIAEYAEIITAETKFKAADVLAKELARNDTHWWYQARLTEALAALELDLDRNRQPVVLNALLDTISDSSRACQARAAAAKALGRTPIPAGQFNEQAAADALTGLARDMALNYNKAPNSVHWYECFAHLYLAFKTGNEDVSRIPSSSLLRRGTLPAPFTEAEEKIRPLVRHVLSQPPAQRHEPIPTEMTQRLNTARTADSADQN